MTSMPAFLPYLAIQKAKIDLFVAYFCPFSKTTQAGGRWDIGQERE